MIFIKKLYLCFLHPYLGIGMLQNLKIEQKPPTYTCIYARTFFFFVNTFILNYCF